MDENRVESLLLEKLKAYSRENDKPSICDDCDHDPDYCGRNVEKCEQTAAEEAEDDRYKARKEL